jgi:hypothetical protein
MQPDDALEAGSYPRYDDFDLLNENSHNGLYPVRVLNSPEGQRTTRMHFPYDENARAPN